MIGRHSKHIWEVRVVKFLITWQVFETLTQEIIKPLRPGLGQAIGKILESPKVKDGGLLVDGRGGYFIVEAGSADEILEVLGPEIYDNTRIQIRPVAAMEAAGRLFMEWQQQGR